MQTSATSNSPAKPKLNKYGYNTIARHISMALMISAPLFIAAQTWDWGWAWVYSIVTLIGWIVLSLVLAAENPGLLNARGKRVKDQVGTKSWDWIVLVLYFILLFATPIEAGLDYRDDLSGARSGHTSPLIHALGIVLLIAGFIPLTWSMAVNKFFEATVRIQTRNGQKVEDSGPYRYVRHPGYVGIILHFLAIPIALGTWTALIPALMGIMLFVIRTALEDKALQEELPGYKEFATRTRYRLLPGVW